MRKNVCEKGKKLLIKIKCLDLKSIHDRQKRDENYGVVQNKCGNVRYCYFGGKLHQTSKYKDLGATSLMNQILSTSYQV